MRLFLLCVSFIFLIEQGNYSASAGELASFIEKRPLVEKEELGNGPLTALAKGAIYIHQNFISNVYGVECTMEPSCSRYSYQAYSEYGFFIGTILTFDRLMHESDERYVSPVVFNKERRKYLIHDGIKNNTFWWQK